MADIEKYKDLFLSEAKEHIDFMNRSLLELEKNPSRVQLINTIFREAHTLKSMAATLNYQGTARLCHAVEDVLDGLKKKKAEVPDRIDTLFQCFDTLELILKEISENKKEPDTAALVEKLQTLIAVEDSGQKSQMEDKSDKSAEQFPEQSMLSAVARVESVEVKVEILDLLMNLTEELLVTKLRLNRIRDTLQDPELSAAVDVLERLISDVQYNVMQSRLMPIGFVFNRFPRMVRDLARHQGKDVQLQLQGTDIGLDRSMIAEIGESLVHLLRNAVDHAIGKPEERRKAGKPSQGTISLTATRIQNTAVIEVADDGAGMDIEGIRNIAVKCGILSPEAPEEEVMTAIFSGVSTTRGVTEVSGRGLGLNIAQNKIASLGGSIKVKSLPQEGTTFTIQIPLTLAIIKVLFVEVGDRIYAIPLAGTEKLVNVSSRYIKGAVNHESIVLNKEYIPIARLDVMFGMASLELDTQPVVIVRAGEERLGLAVHSFLNTQEVVLKPLNKLVGENNYFAGSTITGSGEAVLILDVANLILSKSATAKDAENATADYAEIGGFGGYNSM